jgi:[ribosomal protein S18]-alanine N-acetyltransferase
MIRPMTTADLPGVLALERALFPEDAWSEETFLGELADRSGTRHYLVSDDAGEIVGYAGLAAAGGQGDIQTIGVHHGRWGLGIGSSLLTALIDEAAARGCGEVFLEVRADNGRAQRLYERFGFERVGVRKRYYQPSGVDAIVMRRPAVAPRRTGQDTEPATGHDTAGPAAGHDTAGHDTGQHKGQGMGESE